MLQGRHSQVQTVDISSYLAGEPAQGPKLKGPIENLYLFCQPDTYDTVFRLLNIDDVRNAYRVGRWVWETPIFPNDWRFAEQLVHEIWAPSDFCAETFRKAVDVPVSVRPHMVSEPPETDIDMRARLGVPREAFMGLAVMDIQSCPSRKNPWAHIDAWRQAFCDDPTAVLVMKLRVSKRTRIVLEELTELVGAAPNIRLVPDDLDHLEIAALHRAADVYLSLHCSEGFGLNIYEALLLGKPVVATHWSANAEYGPRFENYRGVAYELVRYQDWMNHYEDHQFEWAEANVRHAAWLLHQSRMEREPTRPGLTTATTSPA
jgi:glycosyltransferase involved in cell wall biosynthesis